MLTIDSKMYLLLQIAYKMALELPLTNPQNRPSILPCKYLYRSSAIHLMTWQSRKCRKIFALEEKKLSLWHILYKFYKKADDE